MGEFGDGLSQPGADISSSSAWRHDFWHHPFLSPSLGLASHQLTSLVIAIVTNSDHLTI